MSGLLLRFAPTTTRDVAAAQKLAPSMRKAFSTHPWWSDAPQVNDDGSGDLSVMRGDGSVDPLDDAFMAFTDIEAVVSTLESLGPHDWSVELDGSPPVHIVQGKRDDDLRALIAMGMAATFTTPERADERIERIRSEDDE